MSNVKLLIPSFGVVAMVLLVPCALTAQEVQQKPNFIQILTDDQGWGDLGSYGHKFIQSPHIDQLAHEGIKFTACYSADSVCSPSRAAILTGRTPFRTGVYRWVPANHYCHLPAKEITLPQLLRENGYQTGHFGKWHLSHYAEKKIGNSYDYKDFSYGGELVGQPSMKDYGYDYWLATGNVARPDHKNPLNFFLNGKALGKMEGFSAQIVANEFVKWMQKVRKEGQPFFITIWFHEPHGPVNSDPEFVARYPAQKDDPSLAQYLANVTQIDEAVGTIVKSLQEAGVYENTMIWYTSDNGPEGKSEAGTPGVLDSPYGSSRYRGSTGGFRGRKRATHEGGIRVPGIISWPMGLKNAGVVPGTISAEPIIGSDVFPTMLEMANVPLPQGRALDGSSILPLLKGEKMTRLRPLYWRNIFYKFQLGLRDGDWKIVATPTRTEFELYNLKQDPKETTDQSKKSPEVFDRMKKALIAYDKEVMAEGPEWWKQDTRPKVIAPLKNSECKVR